ncbi:MAG: hypothetical protein H6585_05190 [Flavobacteriales bacterium]|nr:hypothetical protein [Flavobacteriales bacterium]
MKGRGDQIQNLILNLTCGNTRKFHTYEMTLIGTAERVQEKVNRLIALHGRLLQEKEALVNQVNHLEKELEEMRIKAMSVDVQSKVKDEISGSSVQMEKEEMEKKITELVREVDKCIALLDN